MTQAAASDGTWRNARDAQSIARMLSLALSPHGVAGYVAAVCSPVSQATQQTVLVTWHAGAESFCEALQRRPAVLQGLLRSVKRNALPTVVPAGNDGDLPSVLRECGLTWCVGHMVFGPSGERGPATALICVGDKDVVDDSALLGAVCELALEVHIKHVVTRQLDAIAPAAETVAIQEAFASLTDNARQVLALLAEGKTGTEVAALTNKSPYTVNWIARHIGRKLSMPWRQAVALYAATAQSEGR